MIEIAHVLILALAAFALVVLSIRPLVRLVVFVMMWKVHWMSFLIWLMLKAVRWRQPFRAWTGWFILWNCRMLGAKI